jgi:hypothetical protein
LYIREGDIVDPDTSALTVRLSGFTLWAADASLHSEDWGVLRYKKTR